MIQQRLNPENKYEKFDSENPTVILGTKKNGTPYKGIEIEEKAVVPFHAPSENVWVNPKLDASPNVDKPIDNVDKNVDNPKKETTPPTKSKSATPKAKLEDKKTLSEWLLINKLVLVTADPFTANSIEMNTKITESKYNSLITECFVRNVN